MKEKLRANDTMNVAAETPPAYRPGLIARLRYIMWKLWFCLLNELGFGHYTMGHITIEKYQDGEAVPYEVCHGFNLFLTVGCNEIFDLVTGASGNHFGNANAQIGIGNDKTTPPAVGQTDLQGASKTYKAMDASYPTAASNGQVTFKSTFGTADANYEWGEFTVKHSSSGKCLNRSTNGGAGWGTKTSGTTWVATVTFTLS